VHAGRRNPAHQKTRVLFHLGGPNSSHPDDHPPEIPTEPLKIVASALTFGYENSVIAHENSYRNPQLVAKKQGLF
jgi:hypothetical protein